MFGGRKIRDLELRVSKLEALVAQTLNKPIEVNVQIAGKLSLDGVSNGLVNERLPEVQQNKVSVPSCGFGKTIKEIEPDPASLLAGSPAVPTVEFGTED